MNSLPARRGVSTAPYRSIYGRVPAQRFCLPRPWLLALLTLTALRWLVASIAPPVPDEAYYWLWSEVPQASYYDHPAMVAVFIRIGTLIAGPTPLGIRLLGPAAMATMTLLLADAAHQLQGSAPGRQRVGLWTALLFNATLMAGVGGILATPDLPQLLFWSFTLWALARLESSQRGVWWLAIGLGCGLTVLSKYTGVLLIFGIILWLISSPKARHWWRHPQLFAGAALTVASTLPILIWNGQNNFVSVIKQGGRLGDGGGIAWRYLGELLGSQVGLATPLVFVLCVVGTWGAWRAWRHQHDSAAALLCCLILPSTALFIWQATGSRVQGNWPSLLLPAACLAAAGYCPVWWQAWRKPAVLLGFALVVPVYLQATLGLLPLPRQLDVPLMRMGGWPDFAATVDRQRRAGRGTFLAAENYGLASQLALWAPENVPVIGVASRWRHFNLQALEQPAAGMFMRLERDAHNPLPPGLETIGPEQTVIRTSHGREAERYRLSPVVLNPEQVEGSAILPRPSR